jgi:hypothetical protein
MESYENPKTNEEFKAATEYEFLLSLRKTFCGFSKRHGDDFKSVYKPGVHFQHLL